MPLARPPHAVLLILALLGLLALAFLAGRWWGMQGG